MVDYSAYLVDPNRYQQQGMNNLMQAFKFREDKRKTELTQKLLSAQEERTNAKHSAEMEMDRAKKIAMVAKASDPEQSKLLAKTFGIDGIDWVGDDLQITAPDGSILYGPRSLFMETSPMAAQGDFKGAMNLFMQKGGIVQPPGQAKSLEELMLRNLQSGNIAGAETAANLMGQMESFGKDTRTPQMKNAEALADPNLDPEVKKNLSTLLQKQGLSLEVGPDGTTRLIQGPGAGEMTPTKTTQNKLQEKIVNSYDSISRLDSIVKSFKPEFLAVPDKLNVKWTEIKDKWNIGEVAPEDAKVLEDFSKFRQDSLENINLYIKEITGAQMSEKEANRIRQALPDPGEGLFDGDSPTEFKSKLVNAVKKSKMAVARYTMLLKQGLDERAATKLVNGGSAVSLDEVEKIMEQRFEEYRTQYPKKDLKEIASMVGQEFGLVK